MIITMKVVAMVVVEMRTLCNFGFIDIYRSNRGASGVRQNQQQQYQNQQRCLQNYLNQSFKESEQHAGISYDEGMDDSRSIDNASEFVRQQQMLHNAAQRSVSASRQHHNQSALSIVGANDPRKNDTTFACLQVRRAEFFCTKENLIKHSNYLMRVFERQEFSNDEKERNAQAKIKLPDSTKADILIMFLDYIDKGKELPNKIDLYIAQNVLLIAEALKMRSIQRKFLQEILMPMLNRENIIFFTKMSYNKLCASRNEEQPAHNDDDDLESNTSHTEEEEFWFEFFSYTLDFAASNIQYLIKKKNSEFLNVLETSIIEEIIERAIKFYRADLHYDSSLLFDTLMKVRQCESIFQLLEQERVKIVSHEQSIIDSQNQNKVTPTLIWRIQCLSGNFYRESDPFLVENSQWRLSISYFKMEEEALSVHIKMVNNPFEVKKSKDYFKKKDFFLPSNVAGGIQNQVNPLDYGLDEENLSQEEIQRRKKQIEQANAEYPSHAFVTIVSAIRISQSQKLSDPQVHTLICSAKTPALIKKFSDFRTEEDKGEVVVEIYFKTKYIYSAILLYISKNFTYLITDPMISLLPKDQFKLILKHKFLNVNQEDEVAKAICMWIEGQELRPFLDADLAELLENINWNYVSLQCILDLIRNFPQVRRNPTFHKIINREFALRNKFNPETTNLDPPRFSYKYNKALCLLSKSANKNQKALLYINHENFFENLIESMLEPVDIIKAHLLNEGINESSHRKHLELQLLQRKREIAQIEEQLHNMRLMDELGRESPDTSHLRNGAAKKQSPQKIERNMNEMIFFQADNASGGGDDLETVKNSMINLLNVIVETDEAAAKNQNLNQQHLTSQNQGNGGRHLVELSQEAIQKMQQMYNPRSSLRRDQEDQNYEDKYVDLDQIALNNKIKIIFQSKEDEMSNYDGQDGQQEEGKSEDEEVTEQDVMQQFNHQQDFYQGNLQQQEEEERKTIGLSMIDQANVFGSQQHIMLNQPSHQSLVQVEQRQERSAAGIKLKSKAALLLTSQSSKIIVGGGTLVSPSNIIHHHHHHQEHQVMNESKGVQTSMQNMPSMHNHNQQYQASKTRNDYVDQSIQMTFEEPPGDILKEESMLKNDEIIHKEDIDHFLSHEASSLCGSDRGDKEKSIHSLRSGFEPISAEVPKKESQMPLTRTPAVEEPATILTSPNMEQHTIDSQPNNQGLPLQLSLEHQYQFEQLKIKYQKQLMQEYTQLVEKMSKDVFDQNFLKNFQLFSPNLSQGGIEMQTQDRRGVNNSNSFGTNMTSSFSAMQPVPNQVQVRNPKVHNLNISIHNNANYGSPFPVVDQMPNQTFTPSSGYPTHSQATPHSGSAANSSNDTTQQYQNNNQVYPQQNYQQLNGTMKIPLKTNVKSPTTTTANTTQSQSTPTGHTYRSSQVKNLFKPNSNQNSGKKMPLDHHKQPAQAIKEARQKLQVCSQMQQMPPKSAANGFIKQSALKKPQGVANLQIESLPPEMRTLTVSNPQAHIIDTVKPHYNSQQRASGKQNVSSAGGVYTKPGLNLQGGYNSNVIMPNSVKNSQNIKMYTYHNQQMVHDKIIKASNKNQNKEILQQLLGGDTQQNINLTFNNTTTKQATNEAASSLEVQSRPFTQHQKTNSQPAALYQWSTNGGGLAPLQSMNHEHQPQGQQPRQQQQNEQLQNEIIRMIVDDVGAQQPSKLQQNWMPPASQTPVSVEQHVNMGNFTINKLSAAQSAVPMSTKYAANFNILDQLKQQVSQNTPQYSSQQKRPQSSNLYQAQAFLHNHLSNEKPSGFGSLVTHNQKQGGGGLGGAGGSGSLSGNVILDLAQLKVAAKGGNMNTIHEVISSQGLYTIEESRKSEKFTDGDSFVPNHQQSLGNLIQQHSSKHGRESRQGSSASLNNIPQNYSSIHGTNKSNGKHASISSATFNKNVQQQQQYSRCLPHEME